MSCSRALKWLLLPLLALTLGWKLVVRPDKPGVSAEKEVQRKVAEFLVRQHFTVVVADEAEGQPMLRAASGDCRMLVAKSSSMEWDRDLIRRHATPADRVFTVFHGRVYADQPVSLTVTDFLWARLRRELGLKGKAAPVLTIIATTTCDAERLPWGELDQASYAQ